MNKGSEENSLLNHFKFLFLKEKMTPEKEYQKIISRNEFIIYENHKFYLVHRKSTNSDEIYPKKDWTLKEVLDDLGEETDNL